MIKSLLNPEAAIRRLPASASELPWGEWVALGALSVGASLLYGGTLGLALPGAAARRSALRLTLATGISWLILGPVSWLLLRPRGISLWALAQCCLVTMNYGVAVLLAGSPGNLALAASGRGSLALPYNLGLILASNIVMLRLFVRQLGALGVPAWQAALLWMLLLNGSGAALFATLGVFKRE
jgi:hypothetical protein